jgi:hypothetical protein
MQDPAVGTGALRQCEHRQPMSFERQQYDRIAKPRLPLETSSVVYNY